MCALLQQGLPQGSYFCNTVLTRFASDDPDRGNICLSILVRPHANNRIPGRGIIRVAPHLLALPTYVGLLEIPVVVR